jgi:hypothetical protein
VTGPAWAGSPNGSTAIPRTARRRLVQQLGFRLLAQQMEKAL